jgi:hypothetical protein
MKIELPNKFTHLSDYEKLLIRENWDKMRRIDLLAMINKNRARKISMNKMKCVAYKMGIFKTKSKWFNHNERMISEDKLTCNDRNTISKLYKQKIQIIKILDIINATKDIKISEEELEKHINTYINRKKSYRLISFTNDEIEFIKKNRNQLSCRLIAHELNKNREIKITGQTISNHLKRMNLKGI